MTLDKRLTSKWWRLNHLYKIKNKAGHVITFKPNPIQLRYWAQRGNHRYNRILKARQFGFTTDACVELTDDALWIPGMTCAIIAHERQALDEIFQIVKRAVSNLPDIIKPETKTDTTRMYRFVRRYDGVPLDSSIYVAMRLRSGTVQNLHVSEAAYIKDWAELVAGSKQAVPKTGRITEETTGNGHNHFYDAYMETSGQEVVGEMDYKTYFFPWFDNPEYTLPGKIGEANYAPDEVELKARHPLTDGQLLWRRWKKRELYTNSIGTGLTPEQLFKQEYPSTILEAFQSGAGAVFDPDKLEAVKVSLPLLTYQEEKSQQLAHFGYRIWQEPIRDHVEPDGQFVKAHEYVVGVDPSDGEGSDNSCVDIWDKATRVQVAQFYGKIRPDELAEITAEAARHYNQAYVGVENNMLTTILFLSKIYDNYYFTTEEDEKTKRRTKKIGWRTTVKSRDVMIDEFVIWFEEGELTINSPITLAEMRTFVKKPDTGKREHADGKHDDALFAGMIAQQMVKFWPRKARALAQKPF